MTSVASPPPGPRDLLRLIAVGDPRISPDGTRVAWLETCIVEEEDATRTSLLVAPADGTGSPRTLLELPGLTRPRWSPAGDELAFLAPLDGGPARVASVAADGGEPRPWPDPGGPVSDLAWAPAGDGVAAVVRRPVPAGSSTPPGVVRTSRLAWKQDGVGLVGDRWCHLVWCPREGEARTLVGGAVDVLGAAWRPDGRRLAFLGRLGAESAGAAGRRVSLYVLDVDGLDRAPRRLTDLADVRAGELAWSPDGSELALSGHQRADAGHYAAQRLWRVDATTGRARPLTRGADGTLGNAAYTDVGGAGGDTGPRWLPDGALLCVLSERGRVRLWRVEGRGLERPLTPDDRVIAGVTVSADGRRAALLAWGRGGPGEVELLDLASEGGPRRLSAAGRALSEAVPGLEPRPLRVEGAAKGGAPPLDAWLLLPPGAAQGAARGTPLILYCGGGPGGMRSDNYFLEFQLLAHAGMAVLWLNARGCQGYGAPFCTAILGDWGGADWTDEQRALEAALASEPALDPDRIAIAGGSYGGYQVAWALGDGPRFRAAVADRSVVNKLSAFGTSDIGYLRTFEYGDAAPWDDPAPYLRQSPVQRLAGATTPTLVIHSALDHRCPIEQGEQLYFALRSQGVPCELVRFPNESHGLSRGGRPWHRVARLEAYASWLGSWLGTGSSDASR
jgi:dipeptidyl aminopeptidase/acylaminoacyl peptidase